MPNIQFSWKPDRLDSNTATINFFPDPKTMAIGLATVIKNLQWKSYVILFEDEDGLIRLQEVFKLQEITEENEFNSIILRQLGDDAANKVLFKEIRNSTEIHILLDCHVDRVIGIMKEAGNFGLLDLVYSYFITSLVSFK